MRAKRTDRAAAALGFAWLGALGLLTEGLPLAALALAAAGVVAMTWLADVREE